VDGTGHSWCHVNRSHVAANSPPSAQTQCQVEPIAAAKPAASRLSSIDESSLPKVKL
jgi:hypothetical protein